MFRIRRLVPTCTLSTLTLLLALAGALPAAAQEAAALPQAATTDAVATEPAIPNSKCLGCHDDAEMKNEAGASVAVHEAQFAASAHKRVDCVECHTAALTVKHKGKRQPLGPVSLDVLHGMPRRTDHAVPEQRPRQGQGRQARDLPGLPRQRPHGRAQQQPGCADGPAEPGAQLRRLSRRDDGGLPLQRACQVAVRLGTH